MAIWKLRGGALGGKSLETIEDIGDNYIKYTDGRMIEWGLTSLARDGSYNFPQAFASGTIPVIVGIPAQDWGSYRNGTMAAQSNTTFRVWADTALTWNWTAIGKWK